MATTASTTLQARLDPASKKVIKQAAEQRHIGISDYVRLVLVPLAKKEVESAEHQVLQLSAPEQEEFWNALQAPSKPTKVQRRLGKIMQGKQ